MMTINDMIQSTKDTAQLDAHPYFQALANGTFTKQGFIATQCQFLHAVAFFPRPLLTLAARLPRASMRLPLIENAFEEHGEGELRQSHERTFLRLLAVLGETEPASRPQGAEVTAFNAMFWATCTQGHPLMAIAMIGMFEDLFSNMSTRIGQGIAQNNWLKPDQIEHYTTHETLDQEHAQELYDLLYPHQASESLAIIEQGLKLGVQQLTNLFELLYQNQHSWVKTPTTHHNGEFGWMP